MQRFVPHFLHSPYSTGDFDIRKSAIARTEPLLAISHFVSHATVVFFEETDPQGDAVQSRAVSGLGGQSVDDFGFVRHDIEHLVGDCQPVVRRGGKVVVSPVDGFHLVEVEDSPDKRRAWRDVFLPGLLRL